MTRTQNIKKNLIFNAIKFATQLLLQFLLRTFLIYIMGVEYLGLNGLFTNIFSFLNLAELGIGSSIVFSMYKPIADGDTEKVKSLQALYKKFYIIISIIVLSLGVALLPFIKFFIKGDVSVDVNIYLLYVLYLVNTLVGYLSAHKRSLLFAYQRNDVENKIKSICLIGMTILQIVVLFIFKNYYIFFTVNVVFTLIESILVYRWANKLFPEINGDSKPLDKKTRNQISTNVAALSLQKIGNIVVYSTDNILISALLGVVILGVYSNYYLITSSLVSMFYLFINALTASVGNLIASSDKEYVYKKYKQINFIFSFLAAFTTICLVVLLQPFIEVWTGGGVYLLNYDTVILICLSYYLMRMRNANLIFRDAAGLYNYKKFMPIVEAITNLVVSLVLGYFIGINGIIIGTIVSTLISPFWVEPCVLYKHYFKKNVWEYFKTYIKDFIIMILAVLACGGVCYLLPSGGLWWLILRFAVCAVLCMIVLCALYAPTKEFKESFNMLKNFLKNKFLRKKVTTNNVVEQEDINVENKDTK